MTVRPKNGKLKPRRHGENEELNRGRKFLTCEIEAESMAS